MTAAGVSCQLAEWSVSAVGPEDAAAEAAEAAADAAVAFTQSVTYAVTPDVRLNATAVTVAECLYKGVTHRVRAAVRLINNTHCELVYSWGNPMGSDAGRVDCAFEPANGTVGGNASVEFQLVATPKTSVSTPYDK